MQTDVGSWAQIRAITQGRSGRCGACGDGVVDREGYAAHEDVDGCSALTQGLAYAEHPSCQKFSLSWVLSCSSSDSTSGERKASLLVLNITDGASTYTRRSMMGVFISHVETIRRLWIGAGSGNRIRSPSLFHAWISIWAETADGRIQALS